MIQRDILQKKSEFSSSTFITLLMLPALFGFIGTKRKEG
jgi:hypothetical protein